MPDDNVPGAEAEPAIKEYNGSAYIMQVIRMACVAETGLGGAGWILRVGWVGREAVVNARKRGDLRLGGSVAKAVNRRDEIIESAGRIPPGATVDITSSWPLVQARVQARQSREAMC